MAIVGMVMLGVNGCFLGYDSSFGQQKRAQKNFVRSEAPSTLHAAPSRQKTTFSRTARVRVYATRAYAAEVLDWPRRFATVVDDANAVIAPILDARLEVSDAKPWALKNDDAHVLQLVRSLRELDPGEDVDWVIGLASGTPRFESSFHELGAADVVGKHVVLRAINNAAEYEAIEAGLTELSADERDKFRRERLAHKVTTVLLHELGHTLAAVHEQNKASIMNPAYSRETSGYSPATVDVMRLVFARRTATGGVEAGAFEALSALLRQEPSPWVPRERDELVSRFTRVGPAPPPRTQVKTEALGSVAAPELGALSDTERHDFAEAQALKEARDFARAQAIAISLCNAHPGNASLQELRCQIATQRGLPWDEIEAECREFMSSQRRPRSAP